MTRARAYTIQWMAGGSQTEPALTTSYGLQCGNTVEQQEKQCCRFYCCCRPQFDLACLSIRHLSLLVGSGPSVHIRRPRIESPGPFFILLCRTCQENASHRGDCFPLHYSISMGKFSGRDLFLKNTVSCLPSTVKPHIQHSHRTYSVPELRDNRRYLVTVAACIIAIGMAYYAGGYLSAW